MKKRIGSIVLGLVWIGLIFTGPWDATDHYRYRWDGLVTLHGLNPYLVAPADALSMRAEDLAFLYDADQENQVLAIHALAAEVHPETLDLTRINYPQVPTIYPPASQVFFALAAWIGPGSLWALKLVLVAGVGALLAAAWELRKLCGGSEAAWWLLAAHPLLLADVGLRGHQDILGTALMAWSLVLLGREHRGLSGVLLGISALTKFFPLLAVPIFWRRGGWPWLAAIGLTMAVGYLPVWLGGGNGGAGLQTYLSFWEYNSSLFAVVQWLAGFVLAQPRIAAMAVWVLVVGLGIVWSHRFSDCSFGKQVSALALLLGLFLLAGPVNNSWYWIWALPAMATQRPYFSGLSGVTMLLSPLQTLGGFALRAATVSVMCGPLWLLLLREARLQTKETLCD